MSPTLLLLIIPPALWTLIWLISLINQVDVMGEVSADLIALKLAGRKAVEDYDDLMVTALSNQRRTRLKVGIAAAMFVGGLIALGALFGNVPLLHSVLNGVISLDFFLAGFLFLLLSYHDRAIYRMAAARRIRRALEAGGMSNEAR